MLRITGGEFKGLRLEAPKQIRATEAKVRQALFNILGEAVRGARVLDGYAGSGALGIEALSRGAAFAAFIEEDTEAALAIRTNLDRLSLELPRDAWRVVHLEFSRGVRQLAQAEPAFDLVLLDPPYQADEAKKALNAVVGCAILAPAGILLLEHDQRTIPPASCGPLAQWKRHRYGDTVLSFYRAPSPGAP